MSRPGFKGSVARISSHVDVNRFNGSQANCEAWFGPVVDQPEPAPPPAEIVFSTEAPEGVAFKAVVNGDEYERAWRPDLSQ